jgi:phage terminase large subunit-like protein
LAEEIRQAIGPITASRLKHLLRDSGQALAPLVEGVRQESAESLERTLRALSDLYETGTLEERSRCRGEVIEARQHALWALAKLEGEPRREREEMRATMLVWLENPALFRSWADARRQLR